MARSRALSCPTLIALGIAAELSSPGTAAAEGEVHMASPGLMASLSVGDKVAFGLGLDFRYTLLLRGAFGGCDNDTRAGVGPFVQATWLNFSAGRFAAGVHGGGESFRPYAASEGELGWTYRTAYDEDHPGGHGMHVGALTFVFPAVDFAIRGTIPWIDSGSEPEITFGLGGRFPGPYGIPGATCVIGRPLRTGNGHARPEVVAARRRTGMSARHRRLDPATRSALAAAFLEDGRAECASIPAFLALARELRSVNAPPSLVRRALASARDEARHTALCCALAGDYASADLAAEVLPPPARPVADRQRHLTRLAIESWEDGCLSEGAAAERARRSAAQAADPRVKRTLAGIAADEARHAELAWHIMSYCLAEGGRSAREAVAEAVRSTREESEGEAHGDIDPTAWRAHGRLSREEIESSWGKTRAGALRRAERLLSPLHKGTGSLYRPADGT